MKPFASPREIRGVRLLPVLAIVGALALALRLGGIAGFGAAAQAQRAPLADPPTAVLAAAPAAGPAKAAEPPKPEPRPAPEDDAGFTPAELELLQGLAQRRAALEQQAEELARREALLKAAEQSIDRKLAELKQLQTAVEATLRKNDDEDSARKKSLVRMFESMKPPEAARIFEQMDLGQLVDLVERMKERSAAPILAQMHPVRARQVAAELAKRRQPPAPG